MKTGSFIITFMLILCAAPISIAQEETLITRTIRPRAETRMCLSDMCSSPVLHLSLYLLSKQGSIEVEMRTGLFTITDQLENLEAITRLFEVYRNPNESIEPSTPTPDKPGSESEGSIRTARSPCCFARQRAVGRSFTIIRRARNWSAGILARMSAKREKGLPPGKNWRELSSRWRARMPALHQGSRQHAGHRPFKSRRHRA